MVKLEVLQKRIKKAQEYLHYLDEIRANIIKKSSRTIQ